MKMLWLGVLMLASFLLSFTRFIEADEDIPLDDAEPKDIVHIDLPPPKYDDILLSDEVLKPPSHDVEDFPHDIRSLEADHRHIEKVVANMRQVAEEAEGFIQVPEETILKQDQDFEVEFMERRIEEDSIEVSEDSIHQQDPDVEVNLMEREMEKGVHDDLIGRLGREDEDYYMADDNEEFAVRNIEDNINHLYVEEDASAHLKHVAGDADNDDTDEHVANHEEDNGEKEELKLAELDEDEIVEAEYIGRYVHVESNDADDKKQVRKRPTKIAMDEDEQQALRKVGLLRRSDRGEVGKGDNPNRTTRVYLKHVQDHLRLEEAHAVFEEGSDYVEKVVYMKPEPVVHKHKGNVKFVKHDEL